MAVVVLLIALLLLALLVLVGLGVARLVAGPAVFDEHPMNRTDVRKLEPCPPCLAGNHEQCAAAPSGGCGCFCYGLAFRPDDLESWGLPGSLRYTDDLRNAVWLASRIMRRAGAPAVASVHLGAAIVFTDPWSLGRRANARALVQQWGYAEQSVLPFEGSAQPTLPGEPPEHGDPGPPAFGAETIECLAAAVSLADANRHRWIRPEHVLASLMRQQDSDVARVLRGGGIVEAELIAAAATRRPSERAQLRHEAHLTTPHRLWLPAARVITRGPLGA